MSMISEQVKELRNYSELCLQYCNEKRAKELLKEAADTIESLSAKLAAVNMEQSDRYYGGGWIPCEDRLPEIRNPVLICDGKGNVCIRQIMRIDEFGMAWWSQYSTAVAWQPLPEPYRP